MRRSLPPDSASTASPVAAVILELIQGEAGVRPLDVAYVKKVRELCDINHALLIIDEVQTGIGRTARGSRSSART